MLIDQVVIDTNRSHSRDDYTSRPDVVALVILDIDFEVVVEGDDVLESRFAAVKRFFRQLSGSVFVFAFPRIKLNCLFINVTLFNKS